MFVEVVRLFIVLLATAAGYQLAGGAGAADGRAVLGALLGAGVGYVAGGGMGRLLRGALGGLERRLARASAAELLVGTFGGLLGGALGAVVGSGVLVVAQSKWALPPFAVLVWGGVTVGFRVGSSKSLDLLGMIGLSPRPLTTAHRIGDRPSANAVLVDTSVILDGRLLQIGRSGFLTGDLLVPRFVLDELQGIADAQDPQRRRRGRRGLETLEVLDREARVRVQILDDEVPEVTEVDAKLVSLARRLHVGLLTRDQPLRQIAELQGVPCLDVERLAEGLRPHHVPGDVLEVEIAREGKEPGQGVAFLDDGSMVVVGDAGGQVGSTMRVRVASEVQTSVGRMLFATPLERSSQEA